MQQNEDDLIQAALYGNEVKDTKEDNEVYQFIKNNIIEDGINQIPFIIIFKLFKEQFPNSKLKKHKMNSIFKTYFKVYRTSKGIYYRLTPEPFKLPLDYTFYTDKDFFKNSKGRSHLYAKKVKKQKQYKE